MNDASPNRDECRPTAEVVLCTYNGARFIREQLDSIIGQSIPPDLISVFDDASSDETVELTRSTLERCQSRWRGTFSIRINASNVGYSANFSKALEHATKDYVILCDQDDIWEVDKLRVLVEELRRSGADMVFSDGIPVDESGAVVGKETVLGSYGLGTRLVPLFNLQPMRFLVRRNYVNGAAAAVRTEAARRALPVPDDIPHDYWLAVWAAGHGGIRCVPETLYRYRQHSKNVIGLSAAGGAVSMLRSAWRHPVAPREREWRIWSAMVERMNNDWKACVRVAALDKVRWLSTMFGEEMSPLHRVLWIGRSIACRQYARFGSPISLLRDVISVVKVRRKD